MSTGFAAGYPQPGLQDTQAKLQACRRLSLEGLVGVWLPAPFCGCFCLRWFFWLLIALLDNVFTSQHGYSACMHHTNYFLHPISTIFNPPQTVHDSCQCTENNGLILATVGRDL